MSESSSPNATLRDTPRTDTAASLIKFAVVGEPYELVTAEFARVLERELAHVAGLLAAQLRYNAENPAITPSATARELTPTVMADVLREAAIYLAENMQSSLGTDCQYAADAIDRIAKRPV